MARWTNIREGIDRFISWTKQDSILNPAAKIALQSIPVVGPLLAEVYAEIEVGSPDQQGVPDLLLEILARIEQIGPMGFDDIEAALKESRSEQRQARAALEATRVRINTLATDVEATRKDMSVMIDTLDRMESELTGLAWGLTDFDARSPGDLVSLFTLLGSLLQRSRTIFLEQDRIATAIESCFTRGDSPPREFVGRDDILWWGSRNGRIPVTGEARRQFKELRRVTDRMREVNLRVRSLVRGNRDLLADDIPVDKLDAHLSTWLAKYDYMREHHDDDMCLIFVGVPPTDLPFPSGIDNAVEARLEQAMAEARLAHVID